MEKQSVSPATLYASLGTEPAPLLLDVRRESDFGDDSIMIAGALRRSPDACEQWAALLPAGRTVVVHCVRGGEVSQGIARVLSSRGVPASFLAGGIAAWRQERLPTRVKRPADTNRWITRERPKIDRIACPWLIRRFINPEAEFIYVPADRVFTAAGEQDATPYDIPGAEPFTHDGPLCSFDAFLRTYDVHDAALDQLAVIVRGADTAHPELAPQAPGLHAISLGLSANFPDDHEMLKHSMVIYDALYAWCRGQKSEVLNWTPPTNTSVPNQGAV